MSGIPGTLTGPSIPGPPQSPPGTGSALPARAGHRSYLELAATPGAVPDARRCTRHTLAAWKLDHISGDAELVVSELVTNAIRATLALPRPAPVVLYLAADHDRLTLLVWDASPGEPARRPHDTDAETGRGLELVQALSHQWGTCATGHGGKVVWARFHLDRP
jgi:anti-sigma regulatory factor (Ser/Thr protein kinase)